MKNVLSELAIVMNNPAGASESCGQIYGVWQNQARI